MDISEFGFTRIAMMVPVSGQKTAFVLTGEATMPVVVTVTGIVPMMDQMIVITITAVTAASASHDMGVVTVSALSSCSGDDIFSKADFL